MESAWRIHSSQNDEISPQDAFSLIEPPIARVIQQLQAEGEPVVIAGGFISFAMGITREYNDIDVFVHPLAYVRIASKLRGMKYTLRFQNSAPQEEHGYQSSDMEVYNVYKENRNTQVQIIVILRKWVYRVPTAHENGNAANTPVIGSLFASSLLRDFDINATRCALYQGEYIRR